MRTEFLMAVALVIGTSSVGGAQVCRSAVDGELKKYSIPAERVTITSPARRKLGGDESVHVGYKYWMRVKGCTTGYLVIDTELDCNIDQTFTSGACKIPGVPDC